MIYNIIYMRAERQIGGTPWDQGLEKAKEHAKLQMAAQNADRVEIRDDTGALVFHYPRMLHA